MWDAEVADGTTTLAPKEGIFKSKIQVRPTEGGGRQLIDLLTFVSGKVLFVPSVNIFWGRRAVAGEAPGTCRSRSKEAEWGPGLGHPESKVAFVGFTSSRLPHTSRGDLLAMARLTFCL